MEIVVASNNQGKIKEIKSILEGLGVKVLSEAEAGFEGVDPVEDGDTLEANALIKANAIQTDSAVLADDTGLYVKELGGPGVHTARYAGEHASDADNREKMLRELDGVEDRSAEFITVMVLKYKGEVYKAEGICKGRIAEEEKGDRGFGFDPIFIPEGYDKSFAQMDESVKNSVSHRRRALENLRSILEGLIEDESSHN